MEREVPERPISPPSEKAAPDAHVDARDESKSERVLRCTACGAEIARERDRIAIDGSVTHEFTNPSGIRFRVFCMLRADGAVATGAPSPVWTWFPGHAWQAAACAACAEHLGWFFSRDLRASGPAVDARATFFAFIDDRVI